MNNTIKKSYYFDVPKHLWQVMRSSSQTEVVEKVFFQCIQMWVVDMNKAKIGGDMENIRQF